MDNNIISEARKEEIRQVPDPCVVVIFGASGDLTHRKLLPSIFSLVCGGLLPEQFSVIGVARSDMNDTSFRKRVKDGIAKFSRTKPDECSEWPEFEKNIHYHRANYDDPEAYRGLSKLLGKIDEETGGA